MTSSTIELDSLNEQNLQVMQAYALRATTLKATVESFDGWLERINELAEIPKEDLTRVHGQLIALGFLQFEIAGSNVGLRYQISARGKGALEKALAQVAEAEDSVPNQNSADAEDLPEHENSADLADAA